MERQLNDIKSHNLTNEKTQKLRLIKTWGFCNERRANNIQ